MDRSWRIKYYLCEKLDEFIVGLKKDNFYNFLMTDYLKFLDDQEPELRSIAASKLHLVASLKS